MVPNGWKLGVISDLADTVMGYAFKSADFTKAGIPLLRMGNLYQNTLSFDRNPIYLPKSFKKNYERFLVKPNDLVMSMTGTMGKRDYGFTVKIPTDAPYSLLNQRVIKFVPKHESSSGFLLNLLRSEIILSRLYAIPGGTKQANLSAKQIQELPAPIPPLPEQRKIATILGTWDKAISTTERLIDNSKQQKKALMQQLLTGKKRLLDDSGKPFEGEWEHLHLSDIAKIKKGKALSSKDLEVGEYPVIAGGKTSPYKHSSYTHEKVITVSASGAYAGFVAYHKQKIWASDCSVIEEKQCSDIQFIYQYLLLNQAKIYSFQSGGPQPHIHPKDIEVLKVNLPEIKEQQKIAFVLSNADKEIELLEQQLADLKQEKKALMQQLLTGKRRVKLDDKEIA